MTSYYWAKLWIDLLDDCKVALMNDWLFRRFIMFILAAKEYNHEGLLPPVADLAWRLRLAEKQVADALSALSQVGVAKETSEGWMLIYKPSQKDFEDSEINIDYQSYLNSERWIKKSNDAKKRSGYRCQLCNKSSKDIQLHAHHRTYERLGKELDTDIIVLCSECHRKFHNIDQ